MKMKKTLILMAAAASVVLTGCTENDLSGDTSLAKESAPSAIEFSAKAGNTATTRAVTAQSYNKGTIGNSDAEGVTNLTKARFGVFAYYTGSENYNRTTPSSIVPNFMYNQELQWSESVPTNAWIYSPVKYWPNGTDADNVSNPSHTALQKSEGKLSFFAVAPFTATPSTAYVASTDGIKPAQITDDAMVKKNDATKGINAMTTNAFTGNVWVKYLMPNAAQSEAVDLLWGLAGDTKYDEADGQDPAFVIGESYNTNLTKQTVGEKVSFLFKHALAKIGGTTATATESKEGDPTQCGFKVVADIDENDADDQSTYFPASFKPEETLITIKEVKIQDGKSATSDGDVPVTGEESNLNTFGWFNIETGSWCNESGTYGHETDGATYNVKANNDDDLTNTTYLLNEKILEIGAGKHDAAGTVKKLKDATGKEWSTANPTGVTTTPQNLFANENVPGLLIIPGGDATLYITVDYFVRTADPNLNAGYTEVEQQITNKVSLQNLNPNKYYTIIMHLGLTSVKFEAKVVDWTSKASEAWDADGNDESTGEDNESKVWLPSNVVSANTWSITADPTSFKAKGEATTLTVTMNGVSRAYDATADETHYSLAKVGTADWLTIGADGKLTAGAYTTSTAKRTAIVNVTTIVNGNTITTPITLEQAGFSLANTAAGAANTVVVKDGDDQAVISGYEVTVSGGDGAGSETHTNETITVGGTSGQTYNVTVTHTASGATKTVSVTYTAP